MVWQVLRQVAKGKSWDAISAEWRNTVSKEAIAEAVHLDLGLEIGGRDGAK
jgi:hypothetical protein